MDSRDQLRLMVINKVKKINMIPMLLEHSTFQMVKLKYSC